MGALRLSCLVPLLWLMGCGGPSDPVIQRQFFAFGTLIEVTVADVPPEIAEPAIEAIEMRFHALHRQWHPWEPGPLGDLNLAFREGAAGPMHPSIATLLDRARPLAEASGQLFNPAIGALVRLWGFHDPETLHGPPPEPERIRELLDPFPTIEAIEIQDGMARSTLPGLQLDFGAVAKGVAVDEAIALLRRHGAPHGIVNAGGDLRAIGRRGDRPWRIGIRHPRQAEVLASLEVAGDLAVFTSGDYERFYEYEGKRYHHILDPRTGSPAAGITSVTVVTEEAATADAAATALFVAGPEHWPEVAARLKIRDALVMDRQGVAQLTPGMKQRIRFELDPPPPVVLRPLP